MRVFDWWEWESVDLACVMIKLIITIFHHGPADLMTSARIAMTNDITLLFQYRYRCSFFNFGEHQTTKRKILKSEVTLTMKFAFKVKAHAK